MLRLKREKNETLNLEIGVAFVFHFFFIGNKRGKEQKKCHGHFIISSLFASLQSPSYSSFLCFKDAAMWNLFAADFGVHFISGALPILRS